MDPCAYNVAKQSMLSALTIKEHQQFKKLIKKTISQLLSHSIRTAFAGKNVVFAMTIKLIPKFWRNQEIPEKFWKTYEKVKLDLFQI